MKGIELPVSTIVVIVLILIVLIAVIGLFYGTWPSGAQLANLEAVKNNACQMLVSIGGCDPVDNEKTKTVLINNFDADKDGVSDPGSGANMNPIPPGCTDADATTGDNLFMLCKCYYWIGGATEVDVNRNCKTSI